MLLLSLNTTDCWQWEAVSEIKKQVKEKGEIRHEVKGEKEEHRMRGLLVKYSSLVGNSKNGRETE